VESKFLEAGDLTSGCAKLYKEVQKTSQSELAHVIERIARLRWLGKTVRPLLVSLVIPEPSRTA